MASAGGSLRDRAYQRDSGKCQLCGMDCGRLDLLIEALAIRAFRSGRRFETHSIWHYRLQRWMGQNGFYHGEHTWEADHVTPRTLGGEDVLDNLRTLCRPCHVRETRRLARYRADRKALKRENFPHNFVLKQEEGDGISQRDRETADPGAPG